MRRCRTCLTAPSPSSAGGHDHEGGKGISTRGFSLNHTELEVQRRIDPYWRGQAIFAVQDESVDVEEAWFQSSAIGEGIGLKGGRYRSIGYLNEQHPHQWDFANAPLMYVVKMFGQEASFREDGSVIQVELVPTMFVEFGTQIGRGANFRVPTATRRHWRLGGLCPRRRRSRRFK